MEMAHRERFRRDPRFKRVFEVLTPGRQRGYLYHFAAAKRSATRPARIKEAMPAIFEGRGSRRGVMKRASRRSHPRGASDRRRAAPASNR